MRKISSIRPSSLSGGVYRQKSLFSKHPAFERAFQVLDSMGDVFDGVDTLYKNPDPTLTREGWAMAYTKRASQSLEGVREQAISAAERLSEVEAEAIVEAERKAGLHETLPHAEASEIRAALLRLSPQERDKAIRDAARRGDAAIILAVKSAKSPVLVGGATIPEEILWAVVEDASPGLRELRAEVKALTQALGYAVRVLKGEIDGRADPLAEQKAAEQKAAILRAEARLAAAAD